MADVSAAFLPRLLLQYESLVDDMQQQLTVLTNVKTDWEREPNEQTTTCDACLRKEKTLISLNSQFLCEQEKTNTLRQLVTLYSQRLNNHMRNVEPNGDFQKDNNTILTLSKIKILQNHTQNLQARLNQLVEEKNAIREQLLNAKLESVAKSRYEKMLGKQLVENVKAAYKEEIESLKAKLTEINQVNDIAGKKELEIEREKWEIQWRKREEEWKSKMESLQLEKHGLLMRNSILQKDLQELQYAISIAEKQLDELNLIAQKKQANYEHGKLKLNNRIQCMQTVKESEDRNLNNRSKFAENIDTAQKLLEQKYKRVTAEKQNIENLLVARTKQYENRIRDLEASNKDLMNRGAEDKSALLNEIETIRSRCNSSVKLDDIKLPRVFHNLDIPNLKPGKKNETCSSSSEYEIKRHLIVMSKDILQLKNENNELKELVENERNVAKKWENECQLLLRKLKEKSF